jgi:hypothetical protein
VSIVRWNLKEGGGKVSVGGTRTSSGTSCRTSLLNKTKSNKLNGYSSVNDADIWNEGYSSYLGRSHERVDVIIIRSMDNSCRAKSAEAIVDESNELTKEKESQRTHNLSKG